MYNYIRKNVVFIYKMVYVIMNFFFKIYFLKKFLLICRLSLEIGGILKEVWDLWKRFFRFFCRNCNVCVNFDNLYILGIEFKIWFVMYFLVLCEILKNRNVV